MPKQIHELPAASSLVSSDQLMASTSGNLTRRAAFSALPYLPAGTSAVERTIQGKLRERLSPEDYGAVGDGSADDTAAFTAMLAEAPTEGCCIYLTSGKLYAVNLVIARHAVRIVGSHIGSNISGSAGLTAYNTSLPVIAIGDGDTPYRGIELDHIAFYSDSDREKFVYLKGGHDIGIYRCTFIGALVYALRIEGVDAACPASMVDIFGCHFYSPDSGNADTIQIEALDNSYCTAVKLVGGSLRGPYTGTGRALKLLAGTSAEVGVHIDAHYMQVTDERGIYVDTLCHIYAHGLVVDSEGSGEVLLEINSTAKYPSQFISGHYLIDGNMKNSAAEEVNLRSNDEIGFYYGSWFTEARSVGDFYMAPAANPTVATGYFGANANSLFLSGDSGKGVALIADNGGGTVPVYVEASRLQVYKASSTVWPSIMLVNDTTDVQWLAGSGSPEGAVTANPGSIYSRTDGGAGTSFYVKESGSGNTGWVAK